MQSTVGEFKTTNWQPGRRERLKELEGEKWIHSVDRMGDSVDLADLSDVWSLLNEIIRP